jgi:hypothetical protein
MFVPGFGVGELRLTQYVSHCDFPALLLVPQRSVAIAAELANMKETKVPGGIRTQGGEGQMIFNCYNKRFYDFSRN